MKPSFLIITIYCRKTVLSIVSLILVFVSATATADHLSQIESELVRGNLLIANIDMQDPLFGQSVILILKHDEHGTYGIILNRISSVAAAEIMPRTDWSGNPPHVFLGGPVAVNSVRILIQSEQNLSVGTSITEHVWMIDTAAGLIGYSEGFAGNLTSNVYLGYAGWSPGQLEAEILRGDWEIWPGDAGLIFSQNPENLWFDIQQQLQRVWARLDQSLMAANHMAKHNFRPLDASHFSVNIH